MDREILPLSEVSKRLSYGRSKTRNKQPAKRRRNGRRPDFALSIGEAIRGRLRTIGGFYKSYNPSGPKELQLGDVSTYYMPLNGADIPFGAVVNAIHEEYEDKENAWTLQKYLWSDKPTRSDFLIARPALVRIYNKVWPERR